MKPHRLIVVAGMVFCMSMPSTVRAFTDSLGCDAAERSALSDVTRSTRVDLTQVVPFDFNLTTVSEQQDEVPSTLDEHGNLWRADLTLWAWMVSAHGDIGARGVTADANASFRDILRDSDSLFAFSGRLEVGHGRFGGFVDGMYAKLGLDKATTMPCLPDVGVTFEMTIVDFGLSYRLAEWESEGAAKKNVRNGTFDIYAGARYTDLDITIDPRPLPAIRGDRNWIDPIVGLKTVIPISKHGNFKLNGDIGGFGMNSDITWSVTGVFGLNFPAGHGHGTVYLGYRIIGYDYSRGSGPNRFVWDIINHGPLLGLSISF